MAGGIRIEPYQPLAVRTPAVPGGGYQQVDMRGIDFGQSLGAGLQQFGAGLQQVAKDVGKAPPGQARDNEAVVKTADARLGEAEQALLFDPQNGYLMTQGEAAVAQASAVLDAYAKAHEGAAAALLNDEQRRMFEAVSPRRLETFSEQVQRHSDAERLRWYDTASDARIALAQADAGLYWNDDAMLRRSLGTARAELRDQAERGGWDAALADERLRQGTSAILLSAIGAAAERDPDRAQALRLRYEPALVERDRLGLDALLDEALGRRDAEAASEAIRAGKSPAPSDDAPAPPLNPRTDRPTLEWQLEQAETIAEPTTRARTAARLRSAAAADEAVAETRARELGEQVLSQVTRKKLTDASQIPVRDWTALDSQRRQSIEALLGHNLRGDEPKPDPTLFNELVAQATNDPTGFAKRDLVPFAARLPAAQWQRFRELQAGIRRNDPIIEDEIYAIKRGLQIAGKMLPSDTPGDIAKNYRVELVEEIGTRRRLTGKSPDDTDIADMLKRYIPTESYVTRTLEPNPDHRPDYHQVSGDSTVWGANPAGMKTLFEALKAVGGAVAVNEAIRSVQKMADVDQVDEIAKALDLDRVFDYPGRINNNEQAVYYDPQHDRYFVRHPRGNGFWVEFDGQGQVIGTATIGLEPLPRTAQPPDLDKIWQNPPFPPPPTNRPLPPSTPAEPQSTTVTGPNTDAPRPPTILPGRDPDATRPPTILEGPSIDTPAKPPILNSDSSDADRPSRTHNLPRYAACTAAVYECLSAPRSVPDPDWRRQCQKAEAACNASIAAVREGQSTAPDLLSGTKFPDGTKVIAMPRGRKDLVISRDGKKRYFD